MINVSTHKSRNTAVQHNAPPVLPVSYVTVRPLHGAIVYTIEGSPIPADQWSAVPVSAGIINAIKYGDLEEGEPDVPNPEGRVGRREARRQQRAEEA